MVMSSQPCLGPTSSLQATLRDAFMQRFRILPMAQGSTDAPWCDGKGALNCQARTDLLVHGEPPG